MKTKDKHGKTIREGDKVKVGIYDKEQTVKEIMDGGASLVVTDYPRPVPALGVERVRYA